MIILASSSPRRREILGKFFDIKVYPSEIDERSNARSPKERALDLARKKALAVHSRFPNDTIVAADTIVVLDGEVLGKPKSEREARVMLEKLSGKVHSVITGYCIIHNGKVVGGVEETKVKFRNLSEDLIEWYLSTEEWKDKAGSYGIQGYASIFVEWIQGDYYNVVGLPIKVVVELIKLGFKPRPKR
ncbi:Maf-like protein [Pyrococcus abyssi]|uniref:dTTP/UTP pyrophosphatase n=1 Tax=Pyrococcus abyssi (strain GE5 / Orsay) TaxID=272844 RepID=NTPPA_PYRAB|nr:Maf-like protein [Pyrococcus abyssi]Q9UXZ1.1 RecName: Full=dTTP/UTP pyrophosphatase; Short=dTTPase/UTPase; AltName: Full=Nucleoside triphosphate pyrophosphatase; AltName: Full=Nucleotide pyrophosphatase; Short=Nucleotide PPase [Pyrococcus abyssi GE5]CAB50621.1 Nucleotide-binding protein, Maf septum formation protein related [Pyrococcus abyssi GE5]CCE71188.1 TPA: Maf-like protein [Pyrococcus abyssi GE5]